jgi:hypothetical protein
VGVLVSSNAADDKKAAASRTSDARRIMLSFMLAAI